MTEPTPTKQSLFFDRIPERDVSARLPKRSIGRFLVDKTMDGVKWITETRGRKIGASLLVVGASLGIVGTNKYHDMFSNKDNTRPVVTALIGLEANGVTDASIAKRVDLESGGGTYNPDTRVLTLDLKGDNGEVCEGPFVVADDYESMSYQTTYPNGKTAVDKPLTNPDEVNGAITRYLGSDGCNQNK